MDEHGVLIIVEALADVLRNAAGEELARAEALRAQIFETLEADARPVGMGRKVGK